MTVTLECPCGATLMIEDGSEDRVLAVAELWLNAHGHVPVFMERDVEISSPDQG